MTNVKVIAAEATLEDVVNEANSLYRIVESRIRNRQLPPLEEQKNGDAAEELMGLFYETNPEFAQAYPIVIRYMCQMQEYDEGAFREYLSNLSYDSWKTEDAYLESQAEYVALLYKVKNPGHKLSQVVTLKKNIKDLLTKERELFNERVKAADALVIEYEQTLKQRQRVEFVEFLNVAKDTLDRAGTYTIVSDVAPFTEKEITAVEFKPMGSNRLLD